MLEDLDNQLVSISDRIQDKYRIRRKLEAAENSYQQIKKQLYELEKRLEREEADIKQLEGMSITSLFYTILGTKEERIDKERQEYLAAKLKYDECQAELKDLEKEINELKLELGEISVLERKYQELLRQKEMLDKPKKQNLETAQSEELAKARAKVKEIQEAIVAGRAVISGLEKVLSHLDSAKNWGVWDMVGGGLISTAIKHSRIDDARNAAHHVQHLLRRFERELKDVRGIYNLNIDIGSFATFADYFFDGLIADWVVQSKINQSRENTVRMLRKVEHVVERLNRALKEVEQEINRIAQKI